MRNNRNRLGTYNFVKKTQLSVNIYFRDVTSQQDPLPFHSFRHLPCEAGHVYYANLSVTNPSNIEKF